MSFFYVIYQNTNKASNNIKMKQKLHQKCIELIENNIQNLQESINSAQQTANEDTKSSAGDKYETTRAMMQIEIESNMKRMAEAQKTKKILTEIIFLKQYTEVILGSLVITDKGKFFVSIGIGQMMFEDEKYFVISPDSPIGSLLMHKKINEKIIFNTKEFLIVEIL
ncbi:MAG: 3-oxoacyl-ACP synthase [Bacteroidetes bacterium]|nr:MAG: 3-oxoacyl-ACP synthase [Bacteroidota bacterium]TAG89588.1 MAG: 3-oxoacyl-ACP synthase [Bacteroidota bacterium]